MSIDARIIGVEVTADNEVKLVLEPREACNAHHGTSRMTIENPPADPKRLEVLIGECVWGGNSYLLIGDTKFADRLGYTRLRLLAQIEMYAGLPAVRRVVPASMLPRDSYYLFEGHGRMTPRGDRNLLGCRTR